MVTRSPDHAVVIDPVATLPLSPLATRKVAKESELVCGHEHRVGIRLGGVCPGEPGGKPRRRHGRAPRGR